MSSQAEEEVKSKKPPDTAFRQQRLKTWEPIMTPMKVIILFFGIGIIFVPTGVSLIKTSNKIYEQTINYDFGVGTSCTITKQNEGKVCELRFDISEDVDGPLYVYYDIGNYHQNHRRYVASEYGYQLMGQSISETDLSTYCDGALKNGSLLLNPCGLIANSFFTDIISLKTASKSSYTLDETDISWQSDRDVKFKQPQGFKSSVITDMNNPPVCPYSSCHYYYDTSTSIAYQYYYPNDETVQYLYETYPNQISPIKGVTDEHFIVWMRTAGLPNFRKLYGKISGNFKKGDFLTFQIIANFEVDSYEATKSLVITQKGEFGGQNPDLGVAYITVGSICLVFGAIFGLKHLIARREIGDPSLLKWA